MLIQIKMKNGASFNFKSQTRSDTTSEEYEQQIDLVVYKLYGLTEEEIKIVEAQGGEKNGKNSS